MDAFNAYGWPAKVVSDTRERKRSGTLFGKAMDHRHHNFLPMIPKLGDPGVPESPEENDHLILCHTHGLGPSYIVPKCPQNICFLGHSREKKNVKTMVSSIDSNLRIFTKKIINQSFKNPTPIQMQSFKVLTTIFWFFCSDFFQPICFFFWWSRVATVFQWFQPKQKTQRPLTLVTFTPSSKPQR